MRAGEDVPPLALAFPDMGRRLDGVNDREGDAHEDYTDLILRYVKCMSVQERNGMKIVSKFCHELQELPDDKDFIDAANMINAATDFHEEAQLDRMI